MEISLQPEEYRPRAHWPRGIAGVLLALAVVAVVLGTASTVYFKQQQAPVRRDLQLAMAQANTVRASVSDLQGQIQRLTGTTASPGAGSSTQALTMVQSLLAARVDWEKVFASIGQATPPGLSLNSTQVQMPQPSDGQAGGKIPLNLTGTARRRDDVSRFSDRLRAAHSLFDDVTLSSVSTGVTGQATFQLTITIKAPPALPGGAGSPHPTSGGGGK